MKLHIPQEIVDPKGRIWNLKEIDLKDQEIPLTYAKSQNSIMCLTQAEVETRMTRIGRPEPKGSIVVQGRYECAAAALAMVLGEKLFHVKRAMGKIGWRNDDAGAGDDVMIGAARLLGRDMVKINKVEIWKMMDKLPPCTVTIDSLNIKNMCHAVAWTGEEILDPNWGREGRKFWGCEWAPWTMNARSALVLLDKNLTQAEREEYDESVRSREWAVVQQIRKDVIAALKEAS